MVNSFMTHLGHNLADLNTHKSTMPFDHFLQEQAEAMNKTVLGVETTTDVIA